MTSRKLKFSIALILAAVLMVVSPSPATMAVVEDYIDLYAATGILFYDPEGCADSGGTVSTAGGTAVVSGSTAEEKVWSGLRSMNVTEEVAAGIMGNMNGESGFSPARYETKFQATWESGYDWENDPSESRGVGLIQWSFDRRVNLFKYLREKNNGLVEKYMKKPGIYGGLGGDEFIKKADSPEEANALYSLELTFLIEEMKGNDHYAKVFNETTVSGAAVVFATNVEGCSTCTVGSENTEARRQKAESVYQTYHGKTSFGAGSNGGNANGASQVASSDGSNVTWIGDSITVMTKDKILEKMPKADIYADVSKSFSHDRGDCEYCGRKSGLTILQNLVNENKLRDILIFALGTNDDDVNQATIKKIIEIAPNVKKVVLMTNYKINDEHAFDSNNAAIKAASSIDSRFVVADWAQAVSPDPGKYIIADSDSVHPTTEGIPLFVDTILNAMGTSLSAGAVGDNVCLCGTNVTETGGIWAGQKYDLTDAQLKGLMSIIKKENAGSIIAIKTEASIMANLFEHERPNSPRTGENLANYVHHSTWFKDASSRWNESFSDYTQEEFDAIKAVFTQGLRVIPPQIVEHDDLITDIDYIVVDGNKYYRGSSEFMNMSNYIPGKTIIHQDPGRFPGGGTQWVFYTWANPEGTIITDYIESTKHTGDPFGYYESNPPSKTSQDSYNGGSSVNNSSPKIIWDDNGWIQTGIEGYKKEDAVAHFGANLDSTFGKDFYTDSAKGNGKGPNKILLHSVEGPGGGDSAIHFFSDKGKGVPPHFTVDIKNKKVFQHGSIWKASSAIKGDTYGDLSAGIQIEIFGYTDKVQAEKDGYPDWYLNDDKNFSEDDWKYIAELINAISEETGIPLDSTVKWEGNGERLSNDDFVKYKGVLAHKHAPGNTHWDVEGGVWERIKSALSKVGSGAQAECGTTATGDVSALNKKLLEFAWPDYKGKYPSQRPAYAEVVRTTNYYHGGPDGCPGNDCGGFVTTLMRESGWDPEYNKYNQNTTGWEDPTPPGSGAKGQLYYLKESDKWENVTDKIHSNADAKPGDVLITIESVSTGHTLVYVGDVPGFSSKMASASYSSRGCDQTRSPMADSAEDITYYIKGDGMGRKYHVFRKVK